MAHAEPPSANAAAKYTAKRRAGRRVRAASSVIRPRAESPICAYSSAAKGREAPVHVRAIPRSAPAAVNIQPADRGRVAIKRAARTKPAATCANTAARYGIVADGKP